LISLSSNRTLLSLATTVLAALILFASVLLSASPNGTEPASRPAADLANFSALAPFDAHVHLYKDDVAFHDFLERLNLRVLDIIVIDDRDPFGKRLEPQRSDVLKVAHVTAGRALFCTTFDPYDFEDPGFAQRTIRQLDADFAEGAIAVKIYKVMGMEMKSKAGKWVMADDSAFESIYRDIASHNRTVIAHLAEPDSCWQPPNAASPDYSYYKEHPGEYAYAHPEWPSKGAILAARDHLVAANPKLRVVGAHLGSMETNVDDIAKRLDSYPNFAVDMAARIPYFMLQPRDKVRAFLLKHQDRVLYATDLVVFPRSKTDDTLTEFRNTYARDWKFFSTDEKVEYMGHTYEGLALPQAILRKLFHDNAVRWFPGLGANEMGSKPY
jgi:predicted TIM-barrel fold metal-dependent hydrolase